MTDADLKQTVHCSVCGLTERLIHTDRFLGGRGFSLVGAMALDDTDPEPRYAYVYAVSAGWMVLGIAFLFGMLVVGVPVRELFGQQAGDAVLSVCLAASFFCGAGGFNAAWRLNWYVPQARRRARRDGVDSKRFAISMRRILPRNTSLIFQTAVGILTFVIAVSTL